MINGNSWIFDPLQSKSGTVLDVPGFGSDPTPGTTRLAFSNSIARGFSSFTLPEITLNTQQIEQALAVPPVFAILGPTIGSITLSRGVFINDGEFYKWIMDAAKGNIPFRRDLIIMWAHQRVGVSVPVGPLGSIEGLVPVKAFYFKRVIPIRHKIGPDFDPNSDEVSLQELELQAENFSEIQIQINV
jgi:hypothetical protein